MDTVEDSLLVEEFDLGLGGMHVDVHHVGGQIQVQHTGGEFAHHHLIAVGFLQSGDEQLTLHRSAIDEEGLQIAAGPGIGGLADVAGQGVLLPAAFYFGHFSTFTAINAIDSGLQFARAGGGDDFLTVLDELEGHGRMGQGLHLHGGGDPGTLHGVGFHKLHPGGGVVEEVADDDGGAVRTASLGLFHDLARFQPKGNALDGGGGLGHQVDAADGGDGGQCFAAETAGGDGGQILGGAELGGGVAQECGPGVLGGHTAAVVRDPQEGHAAVLHFDGDLGGTGVHRILKEFLGNGGGPFHHLAGGDEVGNMGR